MQNPAETVPKCPLYRPDSVSVFDIAVVQFLVMSTLESCLKERFKNYFLIYAFILKKVITVNNTKDHS